MTIPNDQLGTTPTVILPGHIDPPPLTSMASRYRSAFLILLVAAISVLFLLVVRRFLLALFLAAVAAGVVQPMYQWLRARTGDRKGLAAAATIVVLLIVVGGLGGGFLTLVTTQSIQVGQSANTWIQDQGGLLDRVYAFVGRFPLIARVVPDRTELAEKLNEFTAAIGPVLFGTAAAVTRSTLSFFLQFFVMLYGLFYFLVHGPATLRRVLDLLPLSDEEEAALLGRFVSVARATLKGSLLIGMIQGTLAGIAFAVARVPEAAFWAMATFVFSIIPGIGSGIVWVPVVLYLMISGKLVTGLLLLVWCAIVVSSVDNLIRPRVVGRDARMSDLMVLISTLGGLLMFGAAGVIVGPIVAALFVTAWDIYGHAFRGWLPAPLVTPVVIAVPTLENTEERKT
jgi:predicted PurR-regulated permease PerM